MKRNSTIAVAALLSLPQVVAAQAAPPAVHVLSSLAESTATRRPVWNGIADPGRTVVLSLDGHLLGRAAVDARGSWGFVTPVELASGAHAVTVWIDGSDPLGDSSVRRVFEVGACGASTDCDGATPVCDVAVGRCRSCEVDRECGDEQPVCSLRRETRGMCVARPPELSSPAPGHAVSADGVVVRGRARPSATVALLVDGREVSRAVSDANGRFTGTLPALARAWHDVSAANVEDGIVGVAGEGSRVLAAGCIDDSNCSRSERCDMSRFVCAAR